MNKLRWTPSEILKIMDDEESLAFVTASIEIYIEAEKKAQKEVERKSRR